MPEPLILHETDNVAILTEKASAGQTPLGRGAALDGPVQAGHKLALTDIATGAPIYKFGQIIGYATAPITEGAHVHSHNCSIGAHDQDYQVGVDFAAAQAAVPKLEPRSFHGYRRPGGEAATRNYIALCATVNCSATVIRRAADAMMQSGVLREYPNVDGVVAFAHGTGCGMASEGPGWETCSASSGAMPRTRTSGRQSSSGSAAR